MATAYVAPTSVPFSNLPPESYADRSVRMITRLPITIRDPSAAGRGDCKRLAHHGSTRAWAIPSDFTIGTGKYNNVTIGISQPDLAMVRISIDLRTFENVGRHCSCARYGGVKVPNLEPE